MADDRLEHAIDTIARRIVADEWDSAPNDLYLDHLEVSDEDARAIVGRVWHLIHDPKPNDLDYDAAREFFATRAEAAS